MEKILNDTILACENCVSKCLQGNKNMNECIRVCHTQELICKTLKVSLKNKSPSLTIKALKDACSQQGKKCFEICSLHKDRHCINCSKENEKLVIHLSK
jgi:hypothetical protein